MSEQQRKPVRIWADGCFDMMHYGHANALRQAKECGDILVVGVHSDAEILKHKGPPVMNEKERYEAVRACKWVDEVVEDAPYVTQVDMLIKHNIDYCVHGDDLSVDANGRDTYEEVKNAGKFKIVKRTKGVSTTDLVGRMLLMTRDHLAPEVRSNSGKVDPAETKNLAVVVSKPPHEKSTPAKGLCSLSTFLASTNLMSVFANGNRMPTDEDKIVYIDGAFDLFHIGHVNALKEARKFGTYLIVGIHDDAVVNQQKGDNLPIMNLNERVLGVLQCRYVDNVITGAPWVITKDVINQLGVSVVAHGSVFEYPESMDDPYRVPREMGILKTFQSAYPQFTTQSIIQRILDHRALYQERNRKKLQKDPNSVH